MLKTFKLKFFVLKLLKDCGKNVENLLKHKKFNLVFNILLKTKFKEMLKT